MHFTNTKYFSEAGNYFLKNGVYTHAIPDTVEHTKFWEEELRRCLEGYSVAGTKITGDHYFYLNYCLINRVEEQGGKKFTTKVISLPDFWDGDYEFFWIRDIAKSGIELEDYKKLGLHSKIKHLAGGKHLICGKSRRKGFSFKTAALSTKEYLLSKGKTRSQILVCAFEEKYVKDNMDKAIEYTNHLNSITNPSPFAKSKLIDTKLHIKAGYTIKKGGINIQMGSKNEILGVTFKDNPDASRGKDPKLVIMEEAGTFANIEDAFYAIEPSLKAGQFTTGQMIILGTGGDMEGGTIQFNKMFYNPDAYNMLAFENIWDEGYSDKPCGFFWPVYLNKEGFIDKEGNSDIQGAIDDEVAIRAEKAKTAKDSTQLTKYITEQPFNPQEAFSVANSNIFNVFDLTLQLKNLEHAPTIDTIGIKGYLTLNDIGKVIFEKDNDNKLYECGFPVTENEKHAGAVVIYEFPPDNIPETLYIAGLDPYAKDQSVYSNSLGACYIYKRSTVNGGTGDRIVASYIGRPETLKQFHETVRRLLLFYNAKCLYENQINSFKEFLENKNCLYLLAETPSCLKATKNSIRKGYGQTMNKDVKLELETYLAEWLLEPNTEGIPNYKFIYDKALLKELISYNDKGNFDRCISLMLCILYKIQLTKVAVEEKKKIVKDNFLTRQVFINRHSNSYL